jgi:hypothetical protein
MTSSLFLFATLLTFGIVSADTPDAAGIGGNALKGWLEIAFYTLGGLYFVLNFYKSHIKEQPDPKSTYVTKEEWRSHCAACMARHSESIERIERANADMLASINARLSADTQARKVLYERLDALNINVAGIKKGLEVIEQREALRAFSQSHEHNR